MLRATEEIKQKLSIVDVVGEYVKLERAGNYLKARCPFHSEKTPSFHVSPDRGTYYCFGCGAKGDAFDFVEQFEGLDFKGALKLLADKAGVTLARSDFQDSASELYDALEKGAQFYESNLKDHSMALAYLRERGLNTETIKAFRIGVAKDAWSTLTEYLKKVGFTEGIIETAGLAKRGDKGSMYDRFRNRIMFPISDPSGRIIGFSGRALDSKEPSKYINSPETPLFIKSKILYGLDKAKRAIKEKNYTIVVEGQFDLVLSHQEGLKNTVAVSGTAFTTEESLESLSHLGSLKRLSSNILFAFDSDQAGIGAAWKATKAAFALGMDVKIIALPEGQDPAALLAENPVLYKDALKNAKRAIPFFADEIVRTAPDERKRGKAVSEKIIPLLKNIPSAIEQTVAIREAAQATGFPESVIQSDLLNVKEEKKKAVEETPQTPKLSLEDKIFGLVYYKESKGLPTEHIKKKLEEILGSDVYREAEEKSRQFKEELLYVSDILYTLHDTSDTDSDVLIAKLAVELIKKKLKSLADTLAQTKADDPEYQILLKDFNTYTQKLQAINKNEHAN
jgi:DNA primase